MDDDLLAYRRERARSTAMRVGGLSLILGALSIGLAAYAEHLEAQQLASPVQLALPAQMHGIGVAVGITAAVLFVAAIVVFARRPRRRPLPKAIALVLFAGTLVGCRTDKHEHARDVFACWDAGWQRAKEGKDADWFRDTRPAYSAAAQVKDVCLRHTGLSVWTDLRPDDVDRDVMDAFTDLQGAVMTRNRRKIEHVRKKLVAMLEP